MRFLENNLEQDAPLDVNLLADNMQECWAHLRPMVSGMPKFRQYLIPYMKFSYCVAYRGAVYDEHSESSVFSSAACRRGVVLTSRIVGAHELTIIHSCPGHTKGIDFTNNAGISQQFDR